MIVKIEQVAKSHADRGALIQDQEPRVVVRELQFPGRTEHALALDAAHLGKLDLKWRSSGLRRRQKRSHERAGDLDPGTHIRSPTDDLQVHARAGIDRAHREPVRIGVFLHGAHGTHHDAGEGRGEAHDVLDLESAHRQQMRELLGGEGWVDKRAQPVFRELHGVRMKSVRGLAELVQEAQVAIVEQAQIMDAVAQHGEALKAAAKRKPDVAFRIESHVLDHRGVYLA